jgi:hypothetical protein
MVGLGILALIIGAVLWLTAIMPAIGWTLMVIGVILIIAGILLGAVWSLSRGAGRGATY